MITNNYNEYSYAELLAAAISPDAKQIDIDTLGEWFEQYGSMFWNGEYYDASADGEPTGSRCLYPVMEWDEQEDCGTIVRYEFR